MFAPAAGRGGRSYLPRQYLSVLNFLRFGYQTQVKKLSRGNRSGGGSGKLWTDGHLQSIWLIWRRADARPNRNL